MKTVYTNKADCYGCGACENICPNSAIAMREDEKGFLYPIIEAEKCVDCQLCRRVCQIGKEKKLQHEAVNSCLGIKAEDTIRMLSSSGGVFTLLTDAVLKKQNSYIVGAGFIEDMTVSHVHAYTKEERNRLRGSKYVQSKINKEYSIIARDLCLGRNILFSGTPCQVAGLKCFLQTRNIQEDNLYTIDVVCHGAPSPMVWQKYVEFLERKYKSKLVNYSFRDKSSGWRGYHIKADFKNGTTVLDNHITRTYANIFLKDLMIRNSCYYCPYNSMSRCGDITIGDFWGIENIAKDFSDNKGISMVFINSGKGRKLLNEALSHKRIEYREFNTSELTQDNLFGPTNIGDDYSRFWQTFIKKGYTKIAKKWGGTDYSEEYITTIMHCCFA